MRAEGGSYAVIFDFGSANTRCGLGVDRFPRSMQPSIVGTPKKGKVMLGTEVIKFATGIEASLKRDILDITGLYNDDGTYCKQELFHNYLQSMLAKELRVESTGRGLLMTEK